ncbi:MAG: T9SS type A sorting domain-containing protein [Saprospiraceae bacterium]|nr:T9SS type A sorting domain-containing protein [Saprospiraceae bacterium]
MDNQIIELDFIDINAGINDLQGNPLFYFDGKNITDASFQRMQNGSQINITTDIGGFPVSQGAIVLPDPGNAHRYFLFHNNYGAYPSGYGVYEVRYSIVDMTLNGGLGAVTEKRKLLINDGLGLDHGKLMAVRHANGRDWWLLTQRKNSGLFYRVLLDPSGVHLLENQVIPGTFYEGLGQAVFSPDGQWHVRFTTVDNFTGQFVDIFQFDRCEGLLSVHSRLHYDENAYSGGAAISYNSHYLYISSFLHIYQFDLWAEDILASKKTIFTTLNPNPVTSPIFHLAQLAPDGRIFIVNGLIAANRIHVIHRPDRGDTLAKLKTQMPMPTYIGSCLPNFPNFRLGPLDGSACDTLGLTNFPVALWRYEQDTSNFLQVEFTDLSYYEPQTWAWDFDDGTTSQDTSPVHTFPGPGAYEVCLTVTNANGSHTWCRTLYLGVPNAVQEAESALPVKIWPNPARSAVFVGLPEKYLPHYALWTVYDATGRPVKVQRLWQGANEVDLSGLPAGVYSCTLHDDGRVLTNARIVKVD